MKSMTADVDMVPNQVDGWRVRVRVTRVSDDPIMSPARRFDGQVVPVAPFLPRAEIVANGVIPEQPERQVAVRGTVPALAVGDHLPVGRHAGRLIDGAQVAGALERALRRNVVRPLHVNGAGHRTAPGSAYGRAVIFPIGARVEK